TPLPRTPSKRPGCGSRAGKPPITVAFGAAAVTAMIVTPAFAARPHCLPSTIASGDTGRAMSQGRRHGCQTMDRRRHAQGPWLASDLRERDGDGRVVSRVGGWGLRAERDT